MSKVELVGGGVLHHPRFFFDWGGFRSPNLAPRLVNIIPITKNKIFDYVDTMTSSFGKNLGTIFKIKYLAKTYN